MALFVLTRRNVAALKQSMRSRLPELGSAHADEALAAGIGFRTHASLLAALKAQGEARLTVMLDELSLEVRIRELTGRDPDSEILTKLVWTTKLPDLLPWSDFGDWWKRVANEN